MGNASGRGADFVLPELAPGDRAPDFVLPGRDGKFYAFCERVRGRPVLLWLGGEGGAPALEGLIAAHADLEAVGVDVFVVLKGPPEGLAAVPEDRARIAVADVAGKVHEGFRGLLGVPGTGPLGLLLDANQRLLARLEAHDLRDRAGLAARVVAALPPSSTALTLGDSAPVLLLPGVIEPELCRVLVDLWRTGGHAEGGVEAVSDGRVEQRVAYGRKRRLDHEIRDESLNRALARRVLRRVGPEIEKTYQFVGFRLDRFLIGCYQAERGDYFRPHRDNLAPTTRDRLFALSINLNERYEGGAVRFPEYGPHGYRPGAGGPLVFSCSLIHEALPVTRGERFVLLSFLRDARKPKATPS